MAPGARDLLACTVMSIVFVTPPPVKPSEPGLSAFAAAEVVRRHGGRARAIDASLGWYRFVLDRGRLDRTLADLVASGRPQREITAFRRAIRSVTETRPLHKAATYRDRRVYTSAVSDLEQALRLVSAPFPGVALRVAQITVDRPGLRPESAAGIDDLSRLEGPLDAFYVDSLIPMLAAAGAQNIGISLTFQPQAPAAFRLARLLRDHLPHVRRILGGPLVACWREVGAALSGAPFDVFDEILVGTDDELERIARQDDADPTWQRRGPSVLDDAPLSVDLDAVDWPRYFSPLPTVPAVLGRGC